VTAVRGVIGKPRIIPRTFKGLHFLQSDTMFVVLATRYIKRSPVAIRRGNPFMYSSFCFEARGSTETSWSTCPKTSTEDSQSSLQQHFCMHCTIVRILISTHVKRLILQLTVSKVSYKYGNFQVLSITAKDRLLTNSSSCLCLEKHWCREVGVGFFTTNRPRCCPPNAWTNATIRTTQPSSPPHRSKPIL
jgi:hypothetical protein